MTTDPLVEKFVRDFDPHDSEFTPELAGEVYRVLREQCPVAQSRAHGGMWVLSRYRDVHSALGDHETFRSGHGVFHPRPAGTPNFAPLESDPPEHTEFRALMKPPLTPPAVRELRPEIERAVIDLLRPLAERGAGDLVRELAVPLPLTVLCMAIGVSVTVSDQIRELTRNTWERMPTDENSDGFWPQFTALFQTEIARARSKPGDDYLSWLVRQRLGDRPLTDAQVSNILVPLSIAGHETTMNAIGHLMSHLAGDMELQLRLRAEPELIPAVIDESMRMWTNVDHGTRFTARDASIAGTTIPGGSRVVLLSGAANRDAAEFADPDEFRLDRRLNRHLSFGYGIHYCLGVHLAKAELNSLLRALAQFPPFELAGQVRRFYENGRHMCLDQLPVRFLRERR